MRVERLAGMKGSMTSRFLSKIKNPERMCAPGGLICMFSNFYLPGENITMRFQSLVL